jgi:UDP-2,3-diacylglucosamine pyrophosphatase LpxH
MEPVHDYDEVHVISDLHLGGSPKGRQIFDLAEPLARFIGHLAQQPKERRVALVINGDLVDFLAEPDATYFDAEGAVAKLDRIMRDASFAPVFQALTRFVSAAGRQLAITLGNHDIELALPWVREHLVRALSGGNEEARGRILTAFDGTGFLCRVRDRRVLCVHGNEVDAWNVTDYEKLRRMGRTIAFGGTQPTGWIPNGGTQMVST